MRSNLFAFEALSKHNGQSLGSGDTCECIVELIVYLLRACKHARNHWSSLLSKRQTCS